MIVFAARTLIIKMSLWPNASFARVSSFGAPEPPSLPHKMRDPLRIIELIATAVLNMGP